MSDFRVGQIVTYHRRGKDGTVPAIGGPATIRCKIIDIILKDNESRWCDCALLSHSSVPVPISFLSHD